MHTDIISFIKRVFVCFAAKTIDWILSKIQKQSKIIIQLIEISLYSFDVCTKTSTKFAFHCVHIYVTFTAHKTSNCYFRIFFFFGFHQPFASTDNQQFEWCGLHTKMAPSRDSCPPRWTTCGVFELRCWPWPRCVWWKLIRLCNFLIQWRTWRLLNAYQFVVGGSMRWRTGFMSITSKLKGVVQLILIYVDLFV